MQSNFIKPFSEFSHSQPLEKYFVIDFSIFCLSIIKLFNLLKRRRKFKQNLRFKHRQLSFSLSAGFYTKKGFRLIYVNIVP